MALSEWRAAIAAWRGRRRRFAEEWAFHRDAAIADFEALGYSRRRAKKMARWRMGARFRHRRVALAEIGGDLRGLWRLLPTRPLIRSAFFVPGTLALGLALALLLNPFRGMAMRSIGAILFGNDLPAADRIIPLNPPGLVPINLAGALLRTMAVAGCAWALGVFLSRKSARALIYSLIVFCEIVAGGAASWVTGMQILASRSWGHDILQGFALLAFAFGFIGLLFVAVRWWWADVENRCPRCLRLPGMPETRGNRNDLLVDPLEVESICFHGHGLRFESRWGRRFHAASEGVR
jgi:hypothetical protein